MQYSSIRTLRHALDTKKLSSAELTSIFLNNIKVNESLNAFITFDEDYAFRCSQEADNIIAKGQTKSLTGIPMAHKDIFCTKVLPTTCGSKMLENFQAPYDATIVQKLAQQHVIMLGKTNMDEFAMGSANENSYFGTVKNPWNLEHVPGGSSGGSAAAVSAGCVSFATGSDTGGSIRQPAAFCGISGLKPTYGLTSRFGMVAYASSLDQAGPMARRAEDIAYILQVMAGFDAHDSTSVNVPIPDYAASLEQPIASLRIGLPRCFFKEAVDSGIRQSIHEALKIFEQLGCQLTEIDFSLQPFWVPCYYLLACAEASSNLSRYDGIRYGYRSQTSASNVLDLITRSRDEAFGLEVKRRILTGTYVLSTGFFDAYYAQAQKVRRMIQNELLESLANVDVILGPTTPSTAFKIGETILNPTERYLADEFTVAANLAGLPAMSIPVGFDTSGLPIGMQLMGKPFSEQTLLNMSHLYQQETDWHLITPNQQRG